MLLRTGIALCFALTTWCSAWSVEGRPAKPRLIAPQLRVSTVAIESGRLVIVGVAPPRALVTLEDRFKARANGAGRFRFDVHYVAEDCIVSLSTSLGAGKAVVERCGPEGAEGEQGPQGERGPRGLKGVKGVNGQDGAQGPQGPPGQQGAQGQPGPPGQQGSPGQAGPAGPAGSGGALFAVVDGDGTWSRGYPSGAGYSSQKVEEPSGTYEVRFGSTDITGCGFLATVGTSALLGTSPAGFAVVVGRSDTPDGVFVQTFDATGVLADRGFHLAVTCPP